ncbi:MAG: hypothetical protein UMR38_02960 [Candidatus Izemoplasma sp.]|nr:hypothetical protein [Candidatus Izemoplasma sp.]
MKITIIDPFVSERYHFPRHIFKLNGKKLWRGFGKTSEHIVDGIPKLEFKHISKIYRNYKPIRIEKNKDCLIKIKWMIPLFTYRYTIYYWETNTPPSPLGQPLTLEERIKNTTKSINYYRLRHITDNLVDYEGDYFRSYEDCTKSNEPTEVTIYGKTIEIKQYYQKNILRKYYPKSVKEIPFKSYRFNLMQLIKYEIIDGNLYRLWFHKDMNEKKEIIIYRGFDRENQTIKYNGKVVLVSSDKRPEFESLLSKWTEVNQVYYDVVMRIIQSSI